MKSNAKKTWRWVEATKKPDISANLDIKNKDASLKSSYYVSGK